MLHILLYLVVGGVIGAAAGKLTSGHAYGLPADVGLGVVGGLIGGLLFGALLGTAPLSLVGELLVVALCASILVSILHLFTQPQIRP
ncbi:MAG: GlsB/YeaQ/YmgE family stress response membrane protein [Candidatus Dormibacteraeota bacterium]|nr:GlsB/YeaQ/YmgE family stress response membrane protein [Candidatus Dormibacteraeota bacterium]MBO0703689.1 GlsB/YeaQ/YmgE family stress response membrane protein [Candidatus Dormibacteraeota bacterium]MBO0762088.1 GlsB/YeaQ/YmgE family stress response membrane protein [Candidatus Dormibacteraeota bacterium]